MSRARAASTSRSIMLVLGAFAVLLGTACQQPQEEMKPFEPKTGKDYTRPLPPGQLALRKIGPEAYPDFSQGFNHRAGLEDAIRNSLDYLSKPSSKKYYPYGDVTHERAIASLKRFLQALQSAKSGQELDAAIRRDFDVYQSVGCDDVGTVLFTGYYCPIFEGRKQRDERFRYPLYKLPPDLVKDAEGKTLGRKLPGGGTGPYPSRREIDEGRILEGMEIAWLSDPFEAYVCSVQGSAKLRQPDGSLYELGYAGNNGYTYTPVAEAMIRDGAIRKEDLSLQTLIRYFKEHPDKVSHYCWQNPRFIFFREAPGGPFGSLGQPVIPFRSVATDKEVYPRACLAFHDTTIPRLYQGQIMQMRTGAFVLDQDTGGAIRAAGRCDVFMGIGPDAEAIAGRTLAEGHLYYVFVKSYGSEQAAATPAPSSGR
ncbi:Membrane-bound lytic murein transglycosylase A precursor [Phycisphaerae bacterium RAS1]|nr:Membrane-bound lytic murein transglycosylase A precursor [Phycisphaerae bacterium RAS1]